MVVGSQVGDAEMEPERYGYLRFVLCSSMAFDEGNIMGNTAFHFSKEASAYAYK